MNQVQMWQKCSFSDWLHRESIMDEWERALKEIRYYDWVIHRKLGEEAGLHCRYIVPARGSGKSLFYTDSFEDARVVTKKTEDDIVKVKELYIDRELLYPVNRTIVEELGEMFRDFQRRKLEYALTKDVVIETYNPYMQPGYWFDPVWITRADGSMALREVSLMPGYLLDKEEEENVPEESTND